MTLLRKILFFIWMTVLSCAAFAAIEHPSINYPINLPPSAQLFYRIKANISGFGITGEAKVNWKMDDSNYSITSETRAPLFGKILEANSFGSIDAFGLAPNKFEEKHRAKTPIQTTFHRDTKSISFSESDETYPIKGGEQDRTSAIWQLVSIARASPKKFIPKSQWTMFVAGRRDAEKWTFIVDKNVMLATPFGKLATVHIIKVPPPDAKDRRIDIWLAPKLDWYPVRTKFSEADGDTIEQDLIRIEK